MARATSRCLMAESGFGNPGLWPRPDAWESVESANSVSGGGEPQTEPGPGSGVRTAPGSADLEDSRSPFGKETDRPLLARESTCQSSPVGKCTSTVEHGHESAQPGDGVGSASSRDGGSGPNRNARTGQFPSLGAEPHPPPVEEEVPDPGTEEGGPRKQDEYLVS